MFRIACAALALCLGCSSCEEPEEIEPEPDNVVSDETPSSARPAPVASAPQSIAAGKYSSCIIDSEQRVYCWGRGPFPDMEQGPPSHVPGLDGAVQIDAARVLCARFEDGRVKCTNGTDTPTPEFVEGLEDTTVIAVGETHGCALKAGGEVWCWGRNDQLQLGSGEATRQQQPARRVPGIDDAVEVTAFRNLSCVRRATGVVTCWGHAHWFAPLFREAGGPRDVPGVSDAQHLALAAYGCIVDNRGIGSCWGAGKFFGQTGWNDSPVAVPGLNGATSVFASSSEICALDADGELRCWTASTNSEQEPRPNLLRDDAARTLSGVRDVSLSNDHGCALLRADRVLCWGDNAMMQVLGEPTMQLPPTTVDGIEDAVAVDAGFDFNCALRRNGRVACWGKHLVLSVDGPMATVVDSATPVEIEGVDDATQLVVGMKHVCVLREDGKVLCWGENHRGELGIGQTERSLTPVVVPGVTGATQIAGGLSHTCALVTGGRILCWGELSAHDYVTRAQPVAGLSGITQLRSGAHMDCGLKADGSVTCWRGNLEPTAAAEGAIGLDQLGHIGAFDGTEAPAPDTSPEPPWTVEGLAAMTQLEVGDRHACARGDDGPLRCWGFNWSEQLGQSGCEGELDMAPCPPLREPIEFSPMPEPEHFALSGEITCVWNGEEPLRCTGLTAAFVRRDPNYDSPGEDATRQLPFATEVRSISFGATPCVVHASGRITCWGRNDDGEVGAGSRQMVGTATEVNLTREGRSPRML